MLDKLIPFVLVVVPADDFSKIVPIPFEAECRVIGQSASPRIVCTLPLREKVETPSNDSRYEDDDKKE